MESIELRGVGRRVGESWLVKDLDLVVEPGEIVALVGPSGGGKTTVLRMIAGLDRPTCGEILIGGTAVARRRGPGSGVAMVFQDDALYSHLDVGENIAFPLIVAGVDRAAARSSALEGARKRGIARLFERRPPELSHGERGLVATTRAITRRNVTVLLMDEPLAKADARIRLQFRSDLRQVHAETGVTTLLATNEQDEAMALADRMAVMIGGTIHQVGPPLEVFDAPVSTAVAGVVGTVPMNLIPARLVWDSGSAHLEVGTDTVSIDPPEGERRDRSVIVGLHAHELAVAKPGTPFDRTIHVTVGQVEHLGASSLVRFGLGPTQGVAFALHKNHPAAERPGDRLELTWVGRLRLFEAGSGITIPM